MHAVRGDGSGGVETVRTTERLGIRTWDLSDVDAFMALAEDPEVLRYTTGGEALPRDKVVERIEAERASQARRGWCRWALALREDPGTVVGFCGPGCGFAPDVEVGWWLRRDLWGRGLATEAALAVLGHCFRTIGFDEVISVIHPENVRSQGVARHLGMRMERTFAYESETMGRLMLQRWELANPMPEAERPRDPRYARGCG